MRQYGFLNSYLKLSVALAAFAASKIRRTKHLLQTLSITPFAALGLTLSMVLSLAKRTPSATARSSPFSLAKASNQ